MIHDGTDSRLSESMQDQAHRDNQDRFRCEYDPIIAAANYLRMKAGNRILTLAQEGVTFSERESRQIILHDCPECPAEIVQGILREIGF